ncbi:MAG: hypothetical protein DRJ50_02540, partial [Actinobacteria bacterium]
MVLLVGYSLVKVVSGALGGDDGVADANGAATTAVASEDGVGDVNGAATITAGSDEGGQSPESSDTATTTDVPVETDPPGPPTQSNRAKVFIVGDSDAGTFGPYLEQLLDGTQIVDTELDYKVSSGLSRPDFYDWPTELRSKLPEADP